MRRRASGQIEIPLPAGEAIWLFTPEGERAWVPGWDPVYPGGEPSESDGTVFVTDVHGLRTTWVINSIDRGTGKASYARTTPGAHAGTVGVDCEDSRPGYCTVTVRYDMTVIDDADESVLDPYRAGPFDQMLDSWATAIRAYLDSA